MIQYSYRKEQKMSDILDLSFEKRIYVHIKKMQKKKKKREK